VISGSDDRIAFVIQTEAQLDGIRAARGEVRGLGTDATTSAQRMSQASQSQAQSIAAVANMSAKSRAAFDAMDADGKRATLTLMGVNDAEMRAALAATDHAKAVGADTQATNQQTAAIERSAVALLRARDAAAAANAASIPRSPIALGAERGLVGSGPMLGPALPPGGLQPDPIENTDRALKKIPGSARTAANALALLSNAAIMGTGSTQGLIVASGGLVTGLAALSKSATIAAAASGIGALVTVAAVAANALYQMGKAAQVSQAQLDNLKNFTAANVLTNLAGIRAARDQALADAVKAADAGLLTRFKNTMGADLTTEKGRAVVAGLGADFSPLEKANQLNEAASKIALEKLRAERLRLVALRDQNEFQIRSNSLEIIGAKAVEGSLDTFKRRRQEIITQAALEDARIKQSFVYRDEQGHIVARTQEQTREMNKLIAQHRELTDVQLHELAQAEQLANAAYKRATATAVAGAGPNVADKYNARIAEINAEADADAQAGRDAVDIEAQKQAKIRALRRDTARAAMEDAKSLTAVLIDSGSKQVRAVGHAAESIRRVVIGAQAAHAAVEAAIEGGKAIGSLAALDFRGAALHGAAALELAKAAALGAQESLGGGRSAGTGGGGGAGGGGTGSTFEPRTGTEGQGSVIVNLYSENPYGAEKIQQVQYLLRRADVLKQPAAVQIAPTTGLRAA
jgi:hypothetical protein